MSKKKADRIDTFADWQVMAECVDRLRELLLESHRIIEKKGFTIFAVGAPFGFNIVIRTKGHGVSVQKILYWDIREGSADFLLGPYDRTPFHDYEF